MPDDEKSYRTQQALRKRNKDEKPQDHPQLDWDLIHRRLMDSSARLTWGDDVDDETLQQIWSRRATQLAEALQESEQGDQLEVAVIQLGNEKYGIDVQFIHDIQLGEKITPVPRTPDWVAGVVNLRGQIISVVDLKRFLRIPEVDKNHESSHRYLVLVQSTQIELALLVDNIIGIQKLLLSHIQDGASFVRGLPIEYVQGVYLDNKTELEHSPGSNGNERAPILTILNFSVLLSDKRLIIQEEVL